MESQRVRWEQSALGRKWCPLHGRSSKYDGICWHCASLKTDAYDRVQENRFAPIITDKSPLAIRMRANHYAMALYSREWLWKSIARELKMPEDEIKAILANAGYEVLTRRYEKLTVQNTQE